MGPAALNALSPGRGHPALDVLLSTAEPLLVVVPPDRLEATIGAAGRLLKVKIKIQREIERGKDLAALLRYDEMTQARRQPAVFRR